MGISRFRPVEQLQPVTLQCDKPFAPVDLRAGPAPYLQCGGSGGECKGVCQDVAWPDFVCPGDFVCGRINAFYWCDTITMRRYSACLDKLRAHAKFNH
jgi:hypothetical protein